MPDILNLEKENKYGDLSGVEIFAAGKWNGDTYTEKDLDGIVQAFNETKDLTKPYLKLGHGEKQKLLAADELPAAGYVKQIYKRGKKILADFVNIPDKIYQLIQKGAYNNVSSEIFVNFESNGKKYPFALKAVALLGAATPAVHTLKQILALYSDIEMPMDLKSDFVKAYSFNVNQNSEIQEDNTMTIEELQRQNTKLEAQVASLEKENGELEKDYQEGQAKIAELEKSAKEFKERAEQSEKKIAELNKEAFDKEVENEVKELSHAGKIVPAQIPFLTELLKNAKVEGEKKFTINEKEYTDIKSLVKAFIDASVEDMNIDGDGETNAGSKDLTGDALIQKAEKYAQDNKVSFKEALLKIAPKGL